MHDQQENLLKEITKLDFAAVDLGLYLNTHPEDQRAINLYNNVIIKADTCRTKYEKLYGPLCSFRSSSRENFWTWINNPWPWSKKFNFNL